MKDERAISAHKKLEHLKVMKPIIQHVRVTKAHERLIEMQQKRLAQEQRYARSRRFMERQRRRNLENIGYFDTTVTIGSVDDYSSIRLSPLRSKVKVPLLADNLHSMYDSQLGIVKSRGRNRQIATFN